MDGNKEIIAVKSILSVIGYLIGIFYPVWFYFTEEYISLLVFIPISVMTKKKFIIYICKPRVIIEKCGNNLKINNYKSEIVIPMNKIDNVPFYGLVTLHLAIQGQKDLIIEDIHYPKKVSIIIEELAKKARTENI